ncbi:MAG: glycoside hydrolase family 97 protein [Bacteroidaceae bacterium]|nr:glycoside hydrolase family 97 protein [Bacteroidaceae bacterium]
MKQLLLTAILCCMAFAAGAQKAGSPNRKLSIKTDGDKFVICYNKKQVLAMTEAPQGKLRFVGKVKDDYRMLTGKRLHCVNEANEYEASIGQDARMVIRLYNDGIAFRYEYTGLQDSKVPEEHTAYIIPEGTKRWMQQWSDSYEGFFPLTTTAKVKALGGFGGATEQNDINTHWGYPLLVEASPAVFALITEANIERRQSASSLFSEGEVFSVKQDRNDLLLSGEWHTPWRVVIIGTLADIVQSTLVTDVSEPSQLTDTSWIKPGVVSWIYWAYNHGSNDYNIIRKYVDMAVTLKLPYVLIDAEWDEMKDGKTIGDAVTYAKGKGVKPLIWYNSSVGWINGAPGPKFRLNKPEDREKEFAWCEKIGVAGVKIDFFSGDNQMNMDFCQDLLESAARHHLLVNFHGATIPRGWQRTWPNLLSTEGVYGAEWYNNVPHFTTKAARHNATLPFTRNVVGPMDYTPCAFSDSQHPHITSKAHELALTVLFESGLQHLADRPESFLAQPQEVQTFLGQLPTVWDETRLVNGYPGESAVLARRSGGTWYVAGINGKDEPQTLATNLRFIGKGRIQMFSDDAEGNWLISNPQKLPSEVSCQPRGGFVLVVSPAP